ncbi:hypothetical protein CGMCC3_g7082 [Colletotrichum fructicola]|nr:uncharacterized protein CGMCC3_g7082 [Colletotrichum fructicola]KAE9576782.1 hypothetical protein CGMCC3_g7082 [Colletotrichum fructicola]
MCAAILSLIYPLKVPAVPPPPPHRVPSQLPTRVAN